jgi:hypothetical protein
MMKYHQYLELVKRIEYRRKPITHDINQTPAARKPNTAMAASQHLTTTTPPHHTPTIKIQDNTTIIMPNQGTAFRRRRHKI